MTAAFYALITATMIAAGFRFPEQTVRAFTVFADVIRLLTTIGLIAGAFCYMTGFSLLPDLAPLEDAMASRKRLSGAFDR